jgi:DNA-binding SARP family transcriptional activator/tetratricopeptide (TPR) repeat protein
MLVLHTFGALALELDGRLASGALSQKRKLALLAILASSGKRGVSRERTASLLWPESSTENARHSLAQLLYSLRRSLPTGAITAVGGSLSLDSNLVSSDVADFDRAIRAGDREAATHVYRGPFLRGFHLPDADEFEDWRSAEAENRARQVVSALHTLIREAKARSDRGKVVELLRRLSSLEPLDSKVATSLMRALDDAGNRPGALQVAAIHESLVRTQLGAPPDRAVTSLVEELRQKQLALPTPTSKGAGPGAASLEVSNVGVHPVNDAGPSALHTPPTKAVLPALTVANAALDAAGYSGFGWRFSLPRTQRLAVSTAAALVIVLPIAAVLSYSRSSAPEISGVDASAVAVLPFSYHGDSASAYLRDGAAELMSANLDGAGELKAVNPRALLSFVRQSPPGNNSVEAADSVARHFKANFFLLGQIAEAGGKLRITASLYERTPRLRIVARSAVDGQSATLFSVVDALTTELLAEKYSSAGERLTRTAARTTYSVPALKAQLLGEQLLRAGKYAEAVDAFQTAVTYDSTFALAYYRLAIASEFAQHMDLGYRAAENAVAHSQRLSEHDRKLVHAYSARRHGDADEAERLYEEILVTHPDDLEAWSQLGEVLFHHNASRGRSFVESKRAWEHVLELNPNDHFALVHLARVLARDGRPQPFEAVIGRAIATASPADKAELRYFRAFAAGSSSSQDSSVAELASRPPLTAWQTVWRLGVYPHNLRGAERAARVLVHNDLSSARSLGNIGLMLIMLGRGRIRDAGAYGARVTQPLPWSSRVPSPQFSGLGFSAVDTGAAKELRARLMDWKAPASSAVSGAGVSYEQLRDHQRRYLIGLLSVRLGDSDAALAAARVLDTMSTIPDARGLPKMFATAILADLALSHGKPADALQLLEHSDAKVPIELSSPFGVEAYIGWLRAESLRLLNRDREALTWYASRVDLFVVELPYLGPSELRQAQIYERLGDPTRGREHYERFLALWKDADPEVRSTISDAREHLAMLDQRIAKAGANRH